MGKNNSANNKRNKLKHDFIFLDESGDPGPEGSDYYACSLLHVNAGNFEKLYSAICNFRFVLDLYRELKSFSLPDKKLVKLNRMISKQRRYFCCSTVYLDKAKYKGPYLHNTGRYRTDPILFRKYIYRQVVDLHFSTFKPISKKIEMVVDRSELGKDHLENLATYLRRYSKIPSLDYLTSVDSRYVDLVQLVDLICGQFKSGDHPLGCKPGFSYSFINSKDITLENSLGEKF